MAAGVPPARDAGDVAINNTNSIPNNNDPEDSIDNIPMPVSTHTNDIANDDDSDANVFMFAAFADKRARTLYLDFTGTFPFMSLKENVYFLVVYHYKMNAIMAMPIANFTYKVILALPTC